MNYYIDTMQYYVASQVHKYSDMQQSVYISQYTIKFVKTTYGSISFS